MMSKLRSEEQFPRDPPERKIYMQTFGSQKQQPY